VESQGPSATGSHHAKIGSAITMHNVAFLHIPKTAGTSFVEMLEANYKANDIIRYYPPEHIPTIPAHRHDGLVMGHFSFGYERCFLKSCKRIVFLREPSTRMLSNLHYAQRYYLEPDVPDNHRCKKWFKNHDEPFDFLAFSKFWFFDNVAVRMLSGVGDRIKFGKLTDEHVQAAKQNLEVFDFIGFQENYAKNASDIADYFSWENKISQVNINPRKVELKPHQKKAVRPFLEKDEALFEYALRMKR